MAALRAEPVVQRHNILGEGPRWNRREGALYWLDATGKRLFRLDPASGAVAEWPMPYGVTSYAFMADGNFLMNYMRGPGIWSPTRGILRMLDMAGISKEERFNDSRCDSRGRHWTGTFHAGLQEPLGHLYCIGADGAIGRRDSGIRMSNGIAWSPDERRMLYCDSWPGRIYVYDFDAADGAIGKRRVLADLSASGGHPDGCAMDEAGGLWVAEVDLWRVARYTPDGRLDRSVAVPTQKPTSLCFGGSDRRTMYITSRRSGLGEAELAAQPDAGALFALRVETPGLPEHDWAGTA